MFIYCEVFYSIWCFCKGLFLPFFSAIFSLEFFNLEKVPKILCFVNFTTRHLMQTDLVVFKRGLFFAQTVPTPPFLAVKCPPRPPVAPWKWRDVWITHHHIIHYRIVCDFFLFWGGWMIEAHYNSCFSNYTFLLLEFTFVNAFYRDHQNWIDSPVNSPSLLPDPFFLCCIHLHKRQMAQSLLNGVLRIFPPERHALRPISDPLENMGNSQSI